MIDSGARLTASRQRVDGPTYAAVQPSLALFAFLGAVIGAAVMGFMGTGSLKSGGMTYADLAAVLLAAVGVIVAIFGGVLAIAAFWGFQQMKQEAVRTATEAALTEVREQIENGSIRRYILDEVEARITEVVASSDFDRRVRDRVDQIVLGRPEDRLLDDDNSGEQS